MPRPVGGAGSSTTGSTASSGTPSTGGSWPPFGWGLVAASPAALVVAGILGVFFDVKTRREEAWLLETYPAYAEYRRRVRKLVPLVY